MTSTLTPKGTTDSSVSAAPLALDTSTRFYSTSIGKKATMAVTGVILLGFVVAHMAGNLKVFTGAVHFDEYAEFLRRIGDPILGHAWALWILRTVLLASVILHIVAATQLSLENSRARPVKYARARTVQASYASRTMRWGGVIILLFVIYHLLHMTTGTVHPDFEHGRVYDNLVAGFEVWYVSAFYIVAMLALGLHIYHGTWSMVQTLGRNSRRLDPMLRRAAAALAIIIVVGNVSIPIAVLTGVVD